MGDMKNQISYVTFQTNFFNYHEPLDNFTYKIFEIICSNTCCLLETRHPSTRPNLHKYIILRSYNGYIVRARLLSNNNNLL